MDEPSVEHKLRGLSVLVVDDHHINREFLRAGLAQIVGRLDAVESGPAAVEACRARAYDIVLMDLHMPHMDGLATANRIRDLGVPSSRARMIILTADARPEQRTRLLQAGFDDYLNKPISIPELTEALTRLVAPRVKPGRPRRDRAPRGLGLFEFRRALAATNGDAAMARQLSRMLGEELDAKLPILDAWIAEGRIEEATSLLHQWSGASGFAGALQFGRACRSLRRGLAGDHASSPGTACVDFLRTAHATRQVLLSPPPHADPD